VTEVDAKGATVELIEGVEGYIRVADIAQERVEDATTVASVGDEIEAKYVGVDRKNRTLSLSVKALFEAEEKEVLEKLKKEEPVFENAMAAAFANAQKD